MGVITLGRRIKPRIAYLNKTLVEPRFQNLWAGLRHGVVFRNATAPLDLVTNAPGSIAGTLVFAEDATGPGFTNSGSAAYEAVPFAETGIARFTAVVLIRVVGALSTNRGVANTAYSNTSGWRMRYQATNSWRLRLKPSGTAANIDVSLTPALGDLILLVGRMDGGTGFNDVFNLTTSVRASNSASFSDTFGSDSSALRVGADSNGAMNNTLFHYVFEWDRNLSDQQIEQIVTDPFGLITLAEDDVGFVAAAGAATDQLLLSTRGRHGAMNVLSGGMAA